MDIKKLSLDIESRGLIKAANVGMSDVRIGGCAEIVSEILRYLEKDPWVMVTNKPVDIA